MSLFLSDTHLGSKFCQAGPLCQFLAAQRDHYTLYLVGDIIDLDMMMNPLPAQHREAIALMLSYPEIVYLPGNHDAEFRAAVGLFSGRVKISDEAVYYSGGKRYLVTHGDRFDPTGLFSGPRWLRRIVSTVFSTAHSRLASSLVEHRIIADAAKLGFDGVICGHTHHPAHRMIDGIEYINCGDWLGHNTAVIDRNGMQLIGAKDDDERQAAREAARTVSGNCDAPA